MNDKKFWKIIYLYITKYNYSILYYRPEKKDVWLINEDNELIRFIYGDSFKSTEIDSIVSNVIRNEVRLKKMFKLSSLKMKILYVSPEFDDFIEDYKKYRISNSLIIERILYNEKNSKLFLKEKDVRLTDKRVLRKALFIPDTLSLYDVLETFKTSGEDFAVVVNEYALVVGVVTLKDVMSIVMGELVNTEEEPQIIRRTEDTWLVDGATPLADVMRALDIEEFPDSENYETIAGFMMYSLRKIPKRTDFLVYAGYKFEIIDTENLKIDQLLVSKQGNMVGKM